MPVDIGTVVSHPSQPPRTCPLCDSARIQTTFEKDPLVYQHGDEQVTLEPMIPFRKCPDCEFRYTDNEAEEIQHAAVCAYLGLMPPSEIRALRDQLEMSRAAFARLTRIGEASLARWEKGLLLQNAANDQLLYLLKHPENVERLAARGSSCERLLHPTAPQTLKLRQVKVTDSVTARAERFTLHPEELIA